jgi:hypothetical protein
VQQTPAGTIRPSAVVESTFRKLAESRKILRLYNTSFQRGSPAGTARHSNGPQFEELFYVLSVPD